MIALNALSLAAGGEPIMGKHRAPDKHTGKTEKDTVTRLFGGVVIVSKK